MLQLINVPLEDKEARMDDNGALVLPQEFLVMFFCKFSWFCLVEEGITEDSCCMLPIVRNVFRLLNFC